MPNYRRNYQEGSTFFFTVVAAGRRRILTSKFARHILRTSICKERERRSFDIVAFVLLPDHLHTIWTLPPGQSDFSIRWKNIKGAFTHEWLKQGGEERKVCNGQATENRRGVWQPRFYEHTIRDEDDLLDHVNYIHYNPVKHNLVNNPIEWKWSSLHSFVANGKCHQDWGKGQGTDHLAPSIEIPGIE